MNFEIEWQIQTIKILISNQFERNEGVRSAFQIIIPNFLHNDTFKECFAFTTVQITILGHIPS